MRKALSHQVIWADVFTSQQINMMDGKKNFDWNLMQWESNISVNKRDSFLVVVDDY